MKKWISLLLAFVMICTAAVAAFAEADEDGDDSVQIPVDAPDEENGEEAFPHHVCKWVRPHHVQTDVFWTKNWKRAKLIYETEYEK